MEAPGGTDDRSSGVHVPIGVRIASEWSWRLLVVAAAIWVLAQAVIALRHIVVPVIIALLICALLGPLVDALVHVGIPRAGAAGIGLIALLVVIVGLLTLVGQQIATGFSDLAGQVADGINTIRQWLVTGPLHLSNNQVQNALDQTANALTRNRGQLTRGALRIGTTLSHVVTGFLLALFSTYFFMYDGARIWSWVVRLFPRAARPRVDSSGHHAWVSLTAFVRATVLVALTDAVGIAIIAFVLHVPLAFPLGVLVFLGAFIPIVGALVSGAAAVLVALVGQGPFVALLMLAGVLLVQQLESHVLQPFLMGRLVRLHPLAVILSIGAGAFIAGIVGALFAVPTAAVVNAIVQHLAATSRAGRSEQPRPDPAASGGST